MSEQLPAPKFDAQNYARPNQNWICGHAGEGKPCSLGPDAKGCCRATAECKPILKIKPGETKGRWMCTRTGGECEAGPLPDGRCCKPIPKCSPVPTLRLIRGRLTLAVIAAACAVILIALGNSSWRDNFINPGTLSQPHSGGVFAMLAETNHLSQGCGACHTAGNQGPAGIAQAALRANPGILDLKKLAFAPAAVPTAMDASCLACHAGHSLHQPAAPAMACEFCHAEHHGIQMAATTDAHCDFCHADAAKMAVSPKTPVLHHFADDHPQFRFITNQWRDPDTLKFNHALHLTGTTIPKLPGGTRLDCAFCHQPDASGTFMKPVAFEPSCRVCHSLQFDPETPELQLPHGSAEFVRAYLRSLPKQYLELATKETASDPEQVARQKLAGLRAVFGTGEELEQRVFFSTATYGPETAIGTLSGTTRAIFPGCAYCHEVKSVAGTAEITKPIQTEHWLTQAKFSHAAHLNISCEKCHDAVHSQDTADIILPPRQTCAECHSPRGGVRDTCAECHSYHNPELVKR